MIDINDLTPEQLERLQRFSINFFESANRQKEIKALSDSELAERLLHEVWAEMQMFTTQSDLVEAAIDRLSVSKP